MPQLVFFREGREVLCFPLTAQQVRIGRHPDNDISLPDLEISRFHLLLMGGEEGYGLENCGRGGTQVNGQSIEKTTLQDQDSILLGGWEIRYQTESKEEERETVIHSLQETFKPVPSFYGLIGQSSVMQQLYRLIEKVASSALPVIIYGETGTGKELVGRALHQHGKRASGPFVPLNCGAIAENLIESELFGHERGSFTGAVTQHAGAFEQAAEGTLFLDEIGELPIALQPKLLRVLEEGTFRRVGGNREFEAPVRIVAATHRRLPEEIAGGGFREDLYYRLSGLAIELPPLRARREDIPLLVEHFLQGTGEGAVGRHFSPAALERLQEHFWPGNVRELRNVIARSLLLSDSPQLAPADLHFLERVPLAKEEEERSLSNAEREVILAKLTETDWNKTETAAQLGIAKSTLFRKLKEYGISKD